MIALKDPSWIRRSSLFRYIRPRPKTSQSQEFDGIRERKSEDDSHQERQQSPSIVSTRYISNDEVLPYYHLQHSDTECQPRPSEDSEEDNGQDTKIEPTLVTELSSSSHDTPHREPLRRVSFKNESKSNIARLRWRRAIDKVIAQNAAKRSILSTWHRSD